MTIDAPTGPTPELRRARAAVAALFLTNGALFANLVPRFPEIKSGLGLDNTAYGLVAAAFPAGAIAVGLAAAWIIRRFGSAPSAVASTVLTALALFAAVVVDDALALAGLLFAAGAADAVTDVAQNAHGLRVQRRYGRSILNSFHALWSVGAVIGGAMAAGAIALDLSMGAHLGATGVLWSLAALAALRYRLPGRDEEAASGTGEDAGRPERPMVGARTALVLAALVVIAIGGTVVENVGSTWAALFLAADLGAPATLAATGFVAMVGAQFVGRLIGDRLVDRFGQRGVARAGGVLIAVGMGLALALPTVPGAVAGFAAAGLGSATLVPAAMHEADELPGLRAGTGLTVVSWLMRLGFLFTPPLVGLIADAAGLRTGLLVVPVAGVAVVLLARVLQARREAAAPEAVAAEAGRPVG